MRLSTCLLAVAASTTLLGGGMLATQPALAAAPGAAAGTTVTNDEPAQVDALAQTRGVTVASTGTVEDVDVTIVASKSGNFTCPGVVDQLNFPNEIYYRLTSPQGTQVRLVTSQFAPGDSSSTYDFNGTTDSVTIIFDDEAANPAGPTWQAGTFRPAEALSSFDGEEAAGTWTLTVGDAGAGDKLCHESFTLDINGGATTDPDPQPAPSIVVDGGPADGSTVTSAPTYRFYSPQGAQKDCRVDTGRWEQCSSPYTVDIDGLEDGEHTVSFRAYNQSGVGEPVTRTFVLDAVPDEPDDTTAPTVSITSGPADGATVDAAPSYGFTSPDEDVATFECSDDGDDFAACTSPTTADVSDPGEHTFAVRAVDTSGNTGQAVTRTYTLRDVACDDATAALEAAQGDLDAAKAKVKVAKEKLRAALASGNPDRIEKARERVANAKEKRSAAKAAVAEAQADVDVAC